MSLPTPPRRPLPASPTAARVRRHAPLGALVAVAVLLAGPQSTAPVTAGTASSTAPAVAAPQTTPHTTSHTTSSPAASGSPAAAPVTAATSAASVTAADGPPAATTTAPVSPATATTVATTGTGAAGSADVTAAQPAPSATTTDASTAQDAPAPVAGAPVAGAPVVGALGSAPGAQGGEVVGIGTPTMPTPDPVPVPVGSSSDGNPLAGQQLYADSQDWTQQQALSTLSGAAAASVRALSAIPQMKWVGPNDQVAWIADYVARATAAGRLPQLVLYAIPGRDCGSFSAGGFTTTAQYLAWVSGVRTAIAGRDAVVVVEPDALAQGSCSGSAADTAARVATIGSAVDILTADRTTAVYIDAGHEWWMTPQVAATRLVAAHVQKARGFSLNVSNFYATDGEVAFGQKVAAIIKVLNPSADPHFVVDTSRNGDGPAPAGQYDWCNPTGRLLGQAPGAVSGQGALDGFLWVKHPGESDGSCRPGDPSSGQWYPSWANDIVARSVAAGMLAAG